MAVMTGKPEKDIENLIEEKKEAEPTYARFDNAIVKMVSDDLELDSSEILNGNAPEGLALTIQNSQEALPMTSIMTRYPTKEEIVFLINRRQFVKNTLIDKMKDVEKIGNTWFLKKIGTQKYINAFGLSIEILDSKVYPKDGDVIAEYRIRATAPNGQSVIADGTKCKSEYWSEKYQNYGSYDLHTLKATARTRAIHIAVSDIVGYGEMSPETFPSKKPSKGEKVFVIEE